MKTKFWVIYLVVVTLLSGVAYVAISEDTDVPLALSDADMEKLRATAIPNSECLRNRPACDGIISYTCQAAPRGLVFIPGNDYRKCYPNYTNFTCHQHNAIQEHCYYEAWNWNCTQKYTWGHLTERWCQTLTN